MILFRILEKEKANFGKGPINVLDFGSFDVNGNVRDALNCSLYEVNADVSEYMYYGVDQSRGPNVNIVATSEMLASWENQFDVITSVSVLEHDDFFWDSVLQLTKLLKVGGILFINVPHRCKAHG